METTSNNNVSPPRGAHRQGSPLNNDALSKLTQRPNLSLGNTSQAGLNSEELESVFKQHPDLFRETAQQPPWDEFRAPIRSGAIHTLLIREHQTASLLREYLLSDSRLFVCAMAERLGDACRQIRKQSYSVIVMAMGQHMHDMLPLLDLMNTSNPRAKAVAVLEQRAIEQLQSMMHPKVLGYVAAEDADQHLADSIIEVSHGRFTASPGISQIVMRLAADYLAQKASTISATSVLSRSMHLVDATHSHERSDFPASTLPSSHLHPSFFSSAPSSNFGEVFGSLRRSKVSTSFLSDREVAILTHIAGGMSSIEIGGELAISVPTVNTHIRNIFTKLGVHTRAQAIHVGMTHGMIEVH